MSARVTCMSLEVIRGGVPPAACRMVCARSGTKSGGPCVCLLLAYPATSLPSNPCTLSEVRSRTLPNLFLSMIKVHLAHSDRSDFPSRFPTWISPLPVTLPQGRQVGPQSENIGAIRIIPGLRTFKSPLFIRTPFVRKVTTRRRCLCC